jgi:hypothetical protein
MVASVSIHKMEDSDVNVLLDSLELTVKSAVEAEVPMDVQRIHALMMYQNTTTLPGMILPVGVTSLVVREFSSIRHVTPDLDLT